MSSAFWLIALIAFQSGIVVGPVQCKEEKAKTGATTQKKQIPYPAEFYQAQKLVLVDKKYKQALDIFDQLDKNGFCRDKTHYYMALCLQNLNQTQEAAQNYQVVYTYSKDQRLKYLAAVGFHQVAKYHAKRTYNGQGNVFKGQSTGPSLCAGRWNSDASLGNGSYGGGSCNGRNW